jgi:hypothetical protein
MKLISIASLLLVVVVAAMVVDAQHHTGDGGVKWLHNCDYFGGDIGGIIMPVEQCGRACIDNQDNKDAIISLTRRARVS